MQIIVRMIYNALKLQSHFQQEGAIVHSVFQRLIIDDIYLFIYLLNNNDCFGF